jgi:hypothetical protein
MAMNVSRPIHAAKPAVSKIWQTTGMLAFCVQQRGDASDQRGGSRRRHGSLEAMRVPPLRKSVSETEEGPLRIGDDQARDLSGWRCAGTAPSANKQKTPAV